MDHFPIFVALKGRRVVLGGGGEAAIAKLRLLLKTKAEIFVFAEEPSRELEAWADQRRIHLSRRRFSKGDTQGAVLAYGAHEDEEEDLRLKAIAGSEGAIVNIVDNLEHSEFITPAMVDRDPVVVAIGTEGAAPVLARAIKANLEAQFSPSLGLMARVGKTFRSAVDALPFGEKRRAFWRDYYFGFGLKALKKGETGLQDALRAGLKRHLEKRQEEGEVLFVGAGPGDPELLTLKARKALDLADVVIHDRLVAPEILELARREALLLDAGKEAFGPGMAQKDINSLILEHAQAGAKVVRLKSGDPAVFGRLDEELDAVQKAGIDFSIIPGITSASAAVATIGQSLTKRGRNSDLRLITGHDMDGFAEADWRAMAQPGAVAAVYMGKKASRFISGRLLMHGASAETPITLIENASRPDEKIMLTNIADLADCIELMKGPVLMLMGIAPREARKHLGLEKPARVSPEGMRTIPELNEKELA